MSLPNRRQEAAAVSETQTVAREVTLPAGRDEVWEALTSEELLEQWLAADVDLDVREGGEGVFRFDDGEERPATIEAVDDAERLVFRWRRYAAEETRVELVLHDVAEGTRLVVVESTLGAAGPQALAGAWELPLLRLHDLCTALRSRPLALCV
jgi:uncharacterized protein YndB with AHSA1/START domain